MSKPNILIFMTDHQRADTALAEHPAISPNLTGLAEQGVLFTNAFCELVQSPHETARGEGQMLRAGYAFYIA